MGKQHIVAHQAATKSVDKIPVTREGFITGMGIAAATLGAAVGLGNIWKFPFLTGANGGAAFLIIYLMSTILIGLPIMISEILLGQRAKGDVVTTLIKMAPKGQPWWLIGIAGILSSFLILAFYTEVVAWVFAYVFKAVSGVLLSTDPDTNMAVFNQLITDPVQSLVWQWVVLFAIGCIVLLGVAKGIEQTTKWLMPILFVLLVVVSIRGLTLPGAGEGLSFLFQPDFSKVTSPMILTAMGLAFFKLSIGMGAMMTYGSYYRNDQHIPLTATGMMVGDLVVSLLAGIAIFPAVFAFGFEPDAGPGLLFVTIPAVFASMPLGSVFVVLFFVLAAVAPIGAMISMLEVPVAFLRGRMGLTRLHATLITIALLAIVGSTVALSNSTLAHFQPFDMTTFDFYDFLTSNILLPLAGLFICLFVGWSWGFSEMQQTLSLSDTRWNRYLTIVLYGIIKFVTPTLVMIILLSGLNLL
ncbi:MAG: Na+-dependent transporter, SNF family [Chloroflexi bacterium AL-W]|nr:Na+-dependent transporter, SNF family [Chloroflexi bacterium AL-N1]NOK64614.1 Na+-dependent transporter, SNF family [Chloroflexi bacterium AL-N10]NOK75855.1 Na+-dependent transporter, SNF family [Chloroflexi bacterium AL-N5]NOK80387.1 Na+-dependent transporter, SNF family [Chloroflexi bacterium AL-W]NOK86900.1 Na+-dependent transporter, SNF family [Chloroflexi bacterium AL-N15]